MQTAQDSGHRHFSPSIHSSFIQQIVPALLGGGGGPALNQAPAGLQLTFPEEDGKSRLGVFWGCSGAGGLRRPLQEDGV